MTFDHTPAIGGTVTVTRNVAGQIVVDTTGTYQFVSSIPTSYSRRLDRIGSVDGEWPRHPAVQQQ